MKDTERKRVMSMIDSIFRVVETMDIEQIKIISAKMLQMLKMADGEIPSVPEETPATCRKCHCVRIGKYGKDKNGKQRYKCNGCGSTFTVTSYSAISGTHCSYEIWEKYIPLLLNGTSLKKCASACGISVQTAFLWRHKILGLLQRDQNHRILGGIVETDETFVSISYKGNHKKSKHFVMPRPAYKRGSDSRAQTGSRACVMCALERNGQSYGEVLGKGQPTIGMLRHAFDNRIMPESIVISDKAVGMRNYFEKTPHIEHIALMAHVRPKSMGSPPEVRGAMHIQNINNLHARFRRSLTPYNGVSTKYLNHYLSLFIWLENHKNIRNFNAYDSVMETLTSDSGRVHNKTFITLPPVPVVA